MVLRIVDHETKLDNQAQDNLWLLGHTITMDSPGHTSLTSAVALFATSPDLVFCLTDVVCPRHTSILPSTQELANRGCRLRAKGS